MRKLLEQDIISIWRQSERDANERRWADAQKQADEKRRQQQMEPAVPTAIKPPPEPIEPAVPTAIKPAPEPRPRTVGATNGNNPNRRLYENQRFNIILETITNILSKEKQ